MNAGRCGSDPWFEYKKLSDLLLKFKPDIVVYTNGSNDMLFDHLNYGGFERFAPDSTVKNRIPQPKWLGLYEVSYVFRFITTIWGYDNTLFNAAQRKKNEVEVIADAHALSQKYNQLAHEHNFFCIQLIRPDKHEIIDGRYVFDVKELTKGTDTFTRFKTFDLVAFYRDSMQVNQQNVNNYFWNIDQHHNAKGYALMAKGAYAAILPLLKK